MTSSLRPRDLSVALAREPLIHRMKVEFAPGMVANCYVLPGLKSGSAYIPEDVAEAIKRTHAPVAAQYGEQDVWRPHMFCHNHDHRPPHSSEPFRHLAKIPKLELDDATPAYDLFRPTLHNEEQP